MENIFYGIKSMELIPYIWAKFHIYGIMSIFIIKLLTCYISIAYKHFK